MAKRPTQFGRGILAGMVFSAWHVKNAHGQDTIAEEIIRHAGWREARAEAQAQDYNFGDDFWAEIERKNALSATKGQP